MSKHEAVWRRGYSSNHEAAAKPKKRMRLIQFMQLVQRYPLALLLMVWAIFVLSAGLAAVSIIRIDASKPQAVSQTSPAIQSLPDLSPTSGLAAQPSLTAPALTGRTPSTALPVQSIFAVGLSCAIGCLIMAQLLKPRRSPKRMQTSASGVSGSARSVQSREAKTRRSAAKVQPESQKPAQPSSSKISIVPSELSHPLDWDDPSLADSLDIRQTKPLSYWL